MYSNDNLSPFKNLPSNSQRLTPKFGVGYLVWTLLASLVIIFGLVKHSIKCLSGGFLLKATSRSFGISISLLEIVGRISSSLKICDETDIGYPQLCLNPRHAQVLFLNAGAPL